MTTRTTTTIEHGGTHALKFAEARARDVSGARRAPRGRNEGVDPMTTPTLSDDLETLAQFVGRLRCMTGEQLAVVARQIGVARATPAGDVDWWRATAAVARDVRRLHRSHAAAIASLRASEAVLAAPGAAEVSRDQAVRVARAAGEVGRALVAGAPESAFTVLAQGWARLVGTRSEPTQPTAA
jgi:hypothetical protein